MLEMNRNHLRIIYRPYVPNEKIEVLFMFQAGTVWASMESVYYSCKEDKRFSVRLVWVKETTVETSHMVGAEDFLIQSGIEYERYEEVDWETYVPHVVFIQFPYDAACHTPETLSIQFRRRGTRVVYIPYGIEISDTEIARKDHFHNYVVENSWRIYTCCEGIKKEYDYYCRNRTAVRVTGSPKFDAISRREQYPLNADIIKTARGRKIVVWKMHFPKKIVEQGTVKQITPYVSEYIRFANIMDSYKDMFFVVLAHPKMLKGVVSSDIQGDDTLMSQVEELMQAIKTKDNAYIDVADDYRNSFYHADAIIMDRSAVMVEAAMLDVPVLLMKNAEYSETMTKPIENIMDGFYEGTVFEDVVNFLGDFSNGHDEKEEIRRTRVRENFPYTDGLCGRRIKDDIVESLKKPESDKPHVILYGTGEVCKYYLSRPDWVNSKKFVIDAVVDSNATKWGKGFCGYTIIKPEQLLEQEFDAIVIMTEPHYFEIKKKLVYDMYIDERKIWRLDEFVYEEIHGGVFG